MIGGSQISLLIHAVRAEKNGSVAAKDQVELYHTPQFWLELD